MKNGSIWRTETFFFSVPGASAEVDCIVRSPLSSMRLYCFVLWQQAGFLCTEDRTSYSILCAQDDDLFLQDRNFHVMGLQWLCSFVICGVKKGFSFIRLFEADQPKAETCTADHILKMFYKFYKSHSSECSRA